MLITEDQRPDSPQKALKSGTGSTIRPAESIHDPPSYDDAVVSSSPASLTSPLTLSMSSSPYYSYHAIPPSTARLPQGSDVDAAKRARRRFMSSLAIALITYIALASFLGACHDFQVDASDVHWM